MYEGDSFFTLTMLQRIGLMGLSGLLAGVTISLAAALMRKQRGSIRLGIVAAAFVLFVWFSPQIYYAYYLTIINGLPLQWVIGTPPTLLELFRIVSFTGQARLSEHGQAALFWGLMGLAVWLRPKTGQSEPDCQK